MTARKVTQRQAEKVLTFVADWMGHKGMGTPICPEGRPLGGLTGMRHPDGSFCEDVTFGPAPTGRDAAYRGLGPELVMDFTGLWTEQPASPAIVLEGGPEEWAIACSFAIQRRIDAAGLPVFVEPAASFILSMYRTD